MSACAHTCVLLCVPLTPEDPPRPSALCGASQVLHLLCVFFCLSLQAVAHQAQAVLPDAERAIPAVHHTHQLSTHPGILVPKVSLYLNESRRDLIADNLGFKIQGIT